MMLKLPLIEQEKSIRDCLRTINSDANGIAFVVNTDSFLLGVITDGDIRRGLINGLDLDAPLIKIMQESFLSVEQGPSQRGRAVRLMRDNRILAIPVIDEQRRPIGIELLRERVEEAEPRDELVVIMAGGQGMRLRPLTHDVPKPMLKVRGKAILQHILEQLIEQGFYRYVITLNYLGDVIREHFQEGAAWGVEIAYTEENKPLGTAGAVGLIDPAPDKTFIVLNGDVISPFDLREMVDHHHQHKSMATMAVSLQRTDLAYGVVQVRDGVITDIEEKPSFHHLVNAGLYVLEPFALKLIPHDRAFNMTDLFRGLFEKGEMTRAFALYEDWVDIGQHEQYELLNEHSQEA